MSSPSAAAFASLLRRVEALEAERAIIDRLHAYGHTIDAGDEAGWLDCFTGDGRFSVESPDPARAPIDIRGRDALAAFIRGHSRPPEAHHQHGLLEPRIVIAADGRTAVSVAMMYSLMRHPGLEPVMRTFGRYRDELAKEDDGVWRIRWRRATLDAAMPGLPPLAYRRSA